MGYSTVLLAFWNDEHMALGVAGTIQGLLSDGKYYTHNGRKYHYVETTSSGWSIGEQPEAIDSYPEIVPISGYPAITASVNGKWNTETETLEMPAKLRNGGDAVASNVYVTGTLSNGLLDSVEREGFVRFIPEGESEEVTLKFDRASLPEVAAGDTPQLSVE